ncbi:MAG: ABC-F family ATP-binding cassette domain-containing protein [Flavobacteriaceae bacterium]
MLSVQNLSVYFGGETLFEDLSFRLGSGDRVGLIGKNGAGKSTLLKILSKQQKPTSGIISLEKKCTLGYLSQDLDFEKGATVLEEAYKAFPEIKALEVRQTELEHLLSTSDDYESDRYLGWVSEISELTTQLELAGGYTYQAETERILKGLGFSRAMFDQSTDSLSGGWRMRIELAKLLLNKHDILLLDEPTNHLDIESILWFEDYLKKYPGAVLVVSHDRMFLDQVTNRTIEIIQRRIFDFKKSYSSYMELRSELRKQQAAAQKNQEKEIQQTERLIERFRSKASKASMAQSLIKKLEKMDRIEVDPDEEAPMKIRFPAPKTPGKVVLRINDVAKTYGDHRVLENVDLELERSTKLAFVGQNGQGKSTLAKIIAGELDHDGKVILGHNVQLGYFAQNQSETLAPELTVLEAVEEAATEENRSRVRDMLGAFLFRGDAVDKKIKVLSGGERNRVALCKLMLEPFNVLLMDEPTNHLDMHSKHVLKEALLEYPGTVILVSHDRDFLTDLCQQTLAFKEGQVRLFLGGINDYLASQALSDMRALEQKTTEATASNKNGSAAEEYSNQKQRKKYQNKVQKLERDIATLEKEIKAIDFELEINYEETISTPDFFDKYNAKKELLQSKMEAWEEAVEVLEGLG